MIEYSGNCLIQDNDRAFPEPRIVFALSFHNGASEDARDLTIGASHRLQKSGLQT